eukprot:166731-Chlamydomonas_euryale.AAC.2
MAHGTWRIMRGESGWEKDGNKTARTFPLLSCAFRHDVIAAQPTGSSNPGWIRQPRPRPRPRRARLGPPPVVPIMASSPPLHPGSPASCCTCWERVPCSVLPQSVPYRTTRARSVSSVRSAWPPSSAASDSDQSVARWQAVAIPSCLGRWLAQVSAPGVPAAVATPLPLPPLRLRPRPRVRPGEQRGAPKSRTSAPSACFLISSSSGARAPTGLWTLVSWVDTQRAGAEPAAVRTLNEAKAAPSNACSARRASCAARGALAYRSRASWGGGQECQSNLPLPFLPLDWESSVWDDLRCHTKTAGRPATATRASRAARQGPESGPT